MRHKEVIMAEDEQLNADKYLASLRKKVDGIASPLPSMSEMIRDQAEGFNTAVRQKAMYGIEDFHAAAPGTQLMEDYSGRGGPWSLMRKLHSRNVSDRTLRKTLESNPPKPISEQQTEREIAFRTKEESYQKKTSDQEKEARERNEPPSSVGDDKLEAEADELRKRLGEDINEHDLLALGEREYQKQFLAVIEDLIKTRASKGHLFGNYKSHIALAEEKYRFYSTERERLIGKEQAKLLMRKKEYTDKLEADKKADPMPDGDLTKKLTFADANQAAYRTDQGKLAKAMREYKECTAKIYELKKRVEALRYAYEQEYQNGVRVVDTDMVRKEQQDGKAVSAEEKARRIVIPGSLRAFDRIEETAKAKEYLPAIKSAASLQSFLDSMQSEIDVWQFHADASLLCVRQLIDPKNEQKDLMLAHRGYISKHFGVDMGGESAKTILRDRKDIVERVGFDSVLPDLPSLDDRRDLKAYRMRWSGMIHSARTGYEKQCASERVFTELRSFNAMKGVSAKVLAKTGKDELSEKEEEGLIERCADLKLLMDPLQIESSRMRNSASTEADVYWSHMENMDTIRQSGAPKDDVKKAILKELPLVRAAFDDIDVFMNQGDSREIFTAKKHEDIFSHTGGMPSFETKARTLRNLISTMLHRSDILEEAEKDPQYEGLQEDLFRKWLFLNRAIGFVDYRRQLMEQGYDSTIEEWAGDRHIVGDFWHGQGHESFRWTAYEKSFIPRKKAALAAAAAGDGDGQPDAAAPEGHIEKARTEGERMLRIREEALKGLNSAQRRLIDVDRYESETFRTRKQQEDAIRVDIWKAMELSSYNAAVNAIRIELAGVRDKIRVAKPEEKDELQRREASLDEDLTSMLARVDERKDEVERRVAAFLSTIKEPETTEHRLEVMEGEFIGQLDEKKSEPSLAPIADELQNSILRLMDPAETPDISTIDERLKELHEFIEPFYIQAADTYIEDAMKAIRSQIGTLSDPYYEKYVEERFEELEKMRQGTSAEAKDTAIAFLRTTYENLYKRGIIIDPEPAIFTMMKQINAMQRELTPARKKQGKSVGFDSTVLVATDIDDEDEEGMIRENFLHFSSEEKAASDIHAEAREQAAGQRLQLEAAVDELEKESKSHQTMLRKLSEDAVKAIPEDKGLTEDEKGILSEMGSLVIPLQDQLSKEEHAEEHKEEHEEEHKEEEALKEAVSRQIENMLILRGGSDDADRFKEAASETIRLVDTAFTDIDAFLKTEAGTKLLMERKPADFSRLKSDAPAPGNYGEDISGLVQLKMKADQTYAVIDLLLDYEEGITEEQRTGLQKKLAALENLREFLAGRERLINKALTRIPDKNYRPQGDQPGKKTLLSEYVRDVQENPEDWRLDAFEWKWDLSEQKADGGKQD